MIFVADEYIASKSGEPYRLLPFGTIFKGGIKHVVDPEIAKQFKLPPWKPAIKLGSHEDATPAGGHIIRLEVREDGLYGYPEYVPSGEKAIADGAYRYHSPEVIWGDQGLEDVNTGKLIPGPYIIGDALLHTPQLGEAAALYTDDPQSTERSTDMAENVSIPKSLYERFMGWVEKPAPIPEPKEEPAGPTPDELSAVVKQRDELAAQVKKIEDDKKAAELKSQIATELKSDAKVDKFGMFSVPVEKLDESAAVLATMNPEQRAWVMQNFAAAAGQIKASKIGEEIGSSGDPAPDNREGLNAAIQAYSVEHKVDYITAIDMLKKDKPDLFTAKR
jgi:hypothetical protein